MITADDLQREQVGVTQGKRALKALLAARLPEVLAMADAADPIRDEDQGDDAVAIATPPPEKIHRTDKAEISTYPTIELIASSASPQADSYAQQLRHRIVVGITLAGSIEQVLTDQVERYVWAVRRIARDVAPDDVACGPIDSGSEEYTPVGQSRDSIQPFVKGGFLELFLTTIE